jgi:acyl dehydratase
MTTTSIIGTRTWAVGDELPALTLPAISRTTLALFAGGSGDHNPIHIDLDVAREAGLTDVFAHGMLSMAYLGRLLTDVFPHASVKQFSSRFAAITPVGAVPTCHGQITDVADGQITAQLRVVLADGTVTLTGQAVIDTTTLAQESNKA